MQYHNIIFQLFQSILIHLLKNISKKVKTNCHDNISQSREKCFDLPKHIDCNQCVFGIKVLELSIAKAELHSQTSMTQE